MPRIFIATSVHWTLKWHKGTTKMPGFTLQFYSEVFLVQIYVCFFLVFSLFLNFFSFFKFISLFAHVLHQSGLGMVVVLFALESKQQEASEPREYVTIPGAIHTGRAVILNLHNLASCQVQVDGT